MSDTRFRPSDGVSVGQLKAHLSKHIARAGCGEEVIITHRGQPVARLVPLPELPPIGRHVSGLVRAGLARAPLKRLDEAWLKAPRPRDPEGRSLQAVLDEGW
jgi:prevent-host-death family protein